MTPTDSSAGGAAAPRTVLHQEPGPGRPPGRRRVVASLAALGVVGLVGGFATYSAFTATTENAGNAFATGSLAITDSDTDGATQAMFALPAMMPGDTVQKCIAVRNSGSLPFGSVELALSKVLPTGAAYAAKADGLDAALQLTVERSAPAAGYTFAETDNTDTGFGCGGRFDAATGTTLSPAGALDGKYTTLGAADTTGWTANAVKVYRFTATLPTGTGDALQNTKAGFTATWTARQ